MRIHPALFKLIFGLFVSALAFQAAPAAQAQATGAQQQSGASNTPAALPNEVVRVGGNVMVKRLVHMVPPVYPAIAKAANVSGTVVLDTLIGRDGVVKKLTYVSGPLLLRQAALDAVQQWQFKPYLLNGQAVEVETSITVVFLLGGGSPSSQGIAPRGGIAVVVPKTVSPGVSAPVTIDPQLRADILTLLDVMHIKTLMDQVAHSEFASLRPALIQGLPDTPHREQIADAYATKLTALLESQDFMDGMAAAYAKYLSDDDVRGVTEFFRTPAGQHYVASAPQLTAAGALVGRQVVLEHLAEILRELCTEYPELQGKAAFCPATVKKESSERLPPKMGLRGEAAAK